MNNEGGRRDFVAFYDTYMPQVHRYVRYRVSDTATAEDLTSSVFEKALRAWPKRRKRQADAAWVFRIARNVVTSHYRRRGRRHEIALDDLHYEPTMDQHPEDTVIRSQRWAKIHKCLAQLSAREQDIIALRFGTGLTNRAIAPIVGIKENHVAVILHRAMRKLHAMLDKE